MRIFLFGAGYSARAFAAAGIDPASDLTSPPHRLAFGEPPLPPMGVEEGREAADPGSLPLSPGTGGGVDRAEPETGWGAALPLPGAVKRGGKSITIAGTTRSAEKFGKLETAGIRPFLFDGGLDDAIRAELAETTHLVISTAPDATGDPVLKALGDQASALLPRLQWIGYLSTVGVYGDHGGDWVDESSECRPVSRRSVQRLKAEQDWTAMAAALGVPLAILRLSGIYGPGRNAFVNLDAGAARRLVKPGQVFNRIHVADIAGALWFLALRQAGGVFNVTDDLPAPPQDVVTAAAAMMGVEPPPEQAFETAELTAMQRSFYGENKRVSNARLKAAGYAFAFPDYQAGLTDLWSGDWRGDGAADARSAMKK